MYASAWAAGETLALSAAKRRGRRSPTSGRCGPRPDLVPPPGALRTVCARVPGT